MSAQETPPRAPSTATLTTPTGCGCTPALIESALDYMKDVVDTEEGLARLHFLHRRLAMGKFAGGLRDGDQGADAAKYPDTPIYFCIGNHDVIGDMNPSGDDQKSLYRDTAELWGDYLDEDAKASFDRDWVVRAEDQRHGGARCAEHGVLRLRNDEVLVSSESVDGTRSTSGFAVSSTEQGRGTGVLVWPHSAWVKRGGHANICLSRSRGDLRPLHARFVRKRFSDVTDGRDIIADHPRPRAG